MAEQTGQYGYVFMFDKVNALPPYAVTAASRSEKYQVSGLLSGLQRNQGFRAICNQHIPMNPRGRVNSLAES